MIEHSFTLANMKVNIVSRKLIKPCTPTPQNLNKYKISSKDELIAPMNVGVLLFYPSPKPKQIIISQLEESLSKILPQFYPLAGRYIKKDYTVDCSDQGAEFVAAEAAVDGVELADLIDIINTEQINHLLPRQCHQVDGATDPLLSVQVTELDCGGVAIGVSVSHRIFDGSSIGTFIAAWSNANCNPGGKTTIVPSFDSLLLFPGKNLRYHPDSYLETATEISQNIVVQRLTFKREAITSLRSKLKPKNGNHRVLSRVQVVCAVIAKALIGVDRVKNGKKSRRPSLIIQSVNMRHRTIPLLPKHSCGNLVIHSVAENCMATTDDDDETGTKDDDSGMFQEIAGLLSEAIERTISDCDEVLSPREDGRDSVVLDREASLIERSRSGEVNDLWFTDWSKFGYDGVDFGWGKPVWAGVGALPLENLTVLMNNRGGDGIEAWVHLNHNDVPYFDQDEDIRLFTT